MPKRRKIGNIPAEDYYDVRQRRWVWIFPRVDRQTTLSQIVDLDAFCEIIFPHSVKKRGVARSIVEILVESKRPMYLREIQYKVADRIKVSAQTLSDTYKAMVRSGLLEKKYRNDPTKLSRQFSARMRDIGQYWENYLTAKKI